MEIYISAEALDQAALERAVAHRQAGAMVTFAGVTRDDDPLAPIEYLFYEAFEDMALEVLREIAGHAESHWGATVAIAHRMGRVAVGEASVIVAVSAGHRAEAFEACRFCIDRLKADAPIWKKESGPQGQRWVNVEADFT